MNCLKHHRYVANLADKTLIVTEQLDTTVHNTRYVNVAAAAPEEESNAIPLPSLVRPARFRKETLMHVIIFFPSVFPFRVERFFFPRSENGLRDQTTRD